MKSACHTVIGEEGWVDGVQKMGNLSAPEYACHQALHGVPCRQALRSITLPDNRSPLLQRNGGRVACTSLRKMTFCGPPSSQKKHCRSPPAALTCITSSVKQRARGSRKRAGAETTLRTALIKHPILPGFCLNDPFGRRGQQAVNFSGNCGRIRRMEL